MVRLFSAGLFLLHPAIVIESPRANTNQRKRWIFIEVSVSKSACWRHFEHVALRRLVLACLHCDQLGIELISAPNGLRVAPVARVRIKRVSKFMLAFIGMRVRPLGGTQ